MRFRYLISAILISVYSFGQTTLFSENMGSPASITAITSYTGFQNYGTLTYSGSGDVRSSSPSSGYTGASGNGNVFLTNAASKNFEISGVNTTTCTNYTLSFGVFKSTTASDGSELTVDVSTDGVTYNTLTMPTLPTGAGTVTWYLATITIGIPSGTNVHFRFTNTSSTTQFRIDDVVLTCGGSSGTYSGCPQITGVILNGCDNGSTPCDEGQSEVIFGNTGGYTVSVAALPTHVINYYGSTANFTAGTINAYTGTFSAHASTTTSLNALSGCSGSFIEAATAGTIPAGATFMMVPYDFCTTNYNLSSICASFAPIYVLYYGTSGAGTANGVWSTSGNFANNQSGTNPKYFTADFTTVSGSCSKLYYSYDAGTESNGNGAGAAWPSSVSTSSASPTDPGSYTSSGCTLPTVLPIELLYFKANYHDDEETALIKWATISETNSDYFELQYSTDGKYFFPYQKIKAGGNSTSPRYYSCAVPWEISADNSYFRLKQVDFNGNYKYSPVILLNDIDDQRCAMYYNNAANKIIFRIYSEKMSTITINLQDMQGTIIFSSGMLPVAKGNNEIVLDSPDAGGVYLISSYQSDGGNPIHKKIIISK